MSSDMDMRVFAEHRRMLREAFTRYGGVDVDTQGDASRRHRRASGGSDCRCGTPHGGDAELWLQEAYDPVVVQLAAEALEHARAELGEEAFAHEWKAGEQLDLGEALALALQSLD